MVSGPAIGNNELMVMVMFPILALVIMALVVFTAVWVYRDATSRGNKDAAIWTVGSLIAWPIVLIVYLIVRPGGQDKPA